MSIEPISRLSVAFGRVLARFHAQRNLTLEAFALAVGLPGADEVTSMELGQREPALSEFFKIANVLGEPPGLLFIDVMDAWRADPTPDTLHRTRASDFARLYRLGYYEALGDFREQQRTYTTLDEATAAAGRLKNQAGWCGSLRSSGDSGPGATESALTGYVNFENTLAPRTFGGRVSYSW